MARPHFFSSFLRILRFRKFTLVLVFSIAALIYWTALPSSQEPAWWQGLHLSSLEPPLDHDGLKCQSLEGANETLVVMRTGSTELAAKLSVHLDTMLRCAPHVLIFSDTAEVFNDHIVLDALESVSSTVVENHKDFELYRRLRDGRDVLLPDELHGWPNETVHESWNGRTENPGWKLDKWKFLPMVNRTFSEYPEGIKWYVFMEADSYIMWPTLLDHLNRLDHTKPYYSGVEVYIDSVAFAHGGSTFVVSPPAMRSVTEYYNAHKEEVERFTDGHWAGDCILGKFFADSGTPLTGAWPTIQGDYPGIVAYMGPDGRPRPPIEANIWCTPAVSYHHVDPSTIKDMWTFEQEQISLYEDNIPKAMTHGYIFDHFIMPRLRAGHMDDWDNDSRVGGKDVALTDNMDDCQTHCENDRDCLQYSIREGHCHTFHLPRLGKPATGMHGVQSGWLVDRVERMRAAMPEC